MPCILYRPVGIIKELIPICYFFEEHALHEYVFWIFYYYILKLLIHDADPIKDININFIGALE